MAVFLCPASADGGIPDYATRRKIQREAAKSVRENLIIYTDDRARPHRSGSGLNGSWENPSHVVNIVMIVDNPVNHLIQKLETIAFSFDEEENITLTDVRGRVRAAFDVERVTKRFYDHFKTEHARFLNFLEGIPDQEMERWYVSVMLNRLMFIYFHPKEGIF